MARFAVVFFKKLAGKFMPKYSFSLHLVFWLRVLYQHFLIGAMQKLRILAIVIHRLKKKASVKWCAVQGSNL